MGKKEISHNYSFESKSSLLVAYGPVVNKGNCYGE